MRKSVTVVLLAAFAVTATLRLASAGVIAFSFANQTPITSPGNTGTIDVVVTETGSRDTLYQFQVEVFLTNHNGSNITLNAATAQDASGAPITVAQAGGYAGGVDGYVFGQNSYNNSFAVANGGQIGVNSPTDIGSFDADTTSGTLLGGGTQYGLMQIEYTIPPGTPDGAYTLSFNTDDPNTDGNADFIDIVSKIDGNHAVSPGLSVNSAIIIAPEPGSAVLLLLGTTVLLGFRGLLARRS